MDSLAVLQCYNPEEARSSLASRGNPAPEPDAAVALRLRGGVAPQAPEYTTRAEYRAACATPAHRNSGWFSSFPRHARACRGHPRLTDRLATKTWMAGTSPAMTTQRAHTTPSGGFGRVHSAASLIACDGGEVSSPEKAFCKIDCLRLVNYRQFRFVGSCEPRRSQPSVSGADFAILSRLRGKVGFAIGNDQSFEFRIFTDEKRQLPTRDAPESGVSITHDISVAQLVAKAGTARLIALDYGVPQPSGDPGTIHRSSDIATLGSLADTYRCPFWPIAFALSHRRAYLNVVVAAEPSNALSLFEFDRSLNAKPTSKSISARD